MASSSFSAVLASLFSPDTYKQVYHFARIRNWEWNLATRHEFHRRQGWLYHLGQHARPGYLIGFVVFMGMAGIDIIAGLGTEIAGETGIDKSAQFKQILAERKEKKAMAQKEKMEFARDTAEEVKGHKRLAD